MSRSWIAAVALVLSAFASPAAAADPVSPDQADVLAASFHAAYPGADVRFEPDSVGATFLGGFRTDPLASDPVQAAWLFLERQTAILGLTDPSASLRVERTLEWRGWTMVRFRQLAYGRPVLGRGFVVVADGAGRVYQVAGSFADVSRVADGTPLSDQQAADALRAIVPTVKLTSMDPAVFVDRDGARFVNLVVVENGGPFERYELVQDAVSGRPIAAGSLFKKARANVYPISPAIDPATTEVDLLGLVSTTALEGDHAESYTCTGRYCSGITHRAAPDGAGDYLFLPEEPSFTDPFSETQAYYSADRLGRYMQDNWGLSWNCRGTTVLKVAVNMDYCNAMFGDVDGDRCGDAMIGQGTERDFAYDSDVIFHEFGHGIFSQLTDIRGWGVFDELGPDFTGEGLNEGTADYVAVTVDGDPRLGEYMSGDSCGGSMGEVGLRNADNSFTCPSALVGESHYDGRILLGTMWEIRTALGAAKADALFFSMLAALSDAADYDEVGRGLLAAATRLLGTGVLVAGDETVVETIVTGRKLVDCVRIVDLYDPDTGESFPGNAFSMGIDETGGWIDEIPSGIQFRIRTPLTAFRATLAIRAATIVEPNSYDLYMRAGAAVHFSLSGYSLTIDGYDQVVTGNPDGFTMATWTTPPLVPGSDYYFTFVHRNPTAVLLNFSASVSLTPVRPDAGDGGDAGEDEVVEDVPVEVVEDVEPEADAVEDAVPDVETPDAAEETLEDAADVDGTITVGDGCGCRTTPPAGLSFLSALLLGAAALLLRRR
ncbi:MAG: hypothetical protein HY905_02140 [Deltaproteobacteria bacterium]|nr:hypothetical protein [Deltaproteobacteria bacterium]